MNDEGEEVVVQRQPRRDDSQRRPQTAKGQNVRRKPSAPSKVADDVDDEGFKTVKRRKPQAQK
jgi:hypothetical protein